MKKVLTILTCFLFLITATEVHQLFRLPFLLEHYRHHRSEDPSLSLFSFLKIHYTDSHPDDQDENEDNRLPFKDGNINHTDTPLIAYRTYSSIPFNNVSAKMGHYFPGYIPDQRADSIFHPPQTS